MFLYLAKWYMLLIQKCWLLNHLAKNKIGTFWRSVKFRNSMQETLKFFVGILGEMMTSYIHSEFNWPLACCWKLCKHRTGSYFSLLFFFSVTLYLNTKQSYLNFWFSVTKFLQKPFLLLPQNDKFFASVYKNLKEREKIWS